jgi:polyhydroxybutyrate depolymerase
MSKTTVVLVVLLIVAVVAWGQRRRWRSRPPFTDRAESVRVDGTRRNYLLHVPPPSTANVPKPLVLVFHGGGGTAANMPRFTGFDDLADAKGFFVAYPDSLNKHWNDGRDLSPADDVAFIRALISDLQLAHKIDPKRIYATGISNGGFFSNRLACDLADKIAAIASVAATMPEVLAPICNPSRPVSVMFIHGTEDPLVPIAGGPVARTHGNALSLTQAARFWRDWDQASPKPVSDDLPEKVHDGTTVHREVFGGGKQATEVVVYTIQGGGHTWPGGSQYAPALFVGKASKNLEATQVIWDFFEKHSIP